jgi:uncharacterized protein (TIGR02231 family)
MYTIIRGVIMIVKSQITAVTVYNDRAEITRTAKEKLEKGEHVLTFDMLPETIEQNSLQTKGRGNAVLKDVKFKTVYFAELPDSDIKSLSDEKQKLEDIIVEMNDKIKHAEKEKTFIEDIAKRLTVSTAKSESFEFDPDKWIKMVEFYRSKNDELDKEIRITKREKNIIQNKLEKIINDIESAGNGTRKNRNQVEISILMNETGEVGLDLIYIVYGPSWHPVYDLRVSTENNSMNISYKALVRQCTSEDWNNIDLKLSTARPSINGQQPELSPWHINIYYPQIPKAAMASAPSGENVKRAAMTQMMRVEEVMPEESDSYEEEIVSIDSAVETGATSVLFVVGGKNNIGSGDEQHKVSILIKDFSAYFRYSCVPKLSQYAYLKAKVKNETEYPFLPGESNVFLDNNFVANSYMDLAAPGEEFWTFLGIDEGMKIVYKFINRYEITEGVFSKTRKLMYEYLTTIKNNKKTEADVVLWDQLPISGNEEITVTMIDPEYKKDTPNLKMDENNYIEWLFKPKPGQEIKVPFKFSIEYPKNISVEGL